MSDFSWLSFTTGLVSGGLAGSIFTAAYNKYINRVQKLSFQTILCEPQWSLPISDENNDTPPGCFKLQYRLSNRTSKDLQKGKLIIVYSDGCIISQAHTKLNKHNHELKGSVRPGKQNEATFKIENFNRKESMVLEVMINGVISQESCKCNVSLDKCSGFKIKRIHKTPKKPISLILENPFEGFLVIGCSRSTLPMKRWKRRMRP
ncbi:MAG: hypothetical protein LHW59_08620 [Candidatus Cloacimonetes bacterium]|nr:hypothetical protein [Candidatus Cloacimonadota bacterium]